MGKLENKGWLYFITRRLAISYMENDCIAGVTSPEKSFLDYLMTEKIKRYADKPFSDYTEDDIFLISGMDFTSRYESDILPNKKEIMEKVPEDINFFIDFLENVAYRIHKIGIYDEVDYDTLKKCMYMRNNCPVKGGEYDANMVLSVEEVTNLPQDVMKDMLATVMDYDNAYSLYNLEFKKCNDLTIPYIKYGTDDRMLLNYGEKNTLENDEEVER